MLCGKNVGIEGLKELQGGLSDLMSQGKDALSQLEGQLSEAQGQLDEGLGKLTGALESEVKSFQTELMSLATSDNPTSFAQKLAQIKKDFGDAIDDLEGKLQELGITSFPPSADDIVTAICSKMPNVELDASGVAKDLPKAPTVPNLPPFPNISKVIEQAKETTKAIAAVDKSINTVFTVIWKELAAVNTPADTRGKFNTIAFLYHYNFMQVLGYPNLDEYVSSRPGINIKVIKSDWPKLIAEIENGVGQDKWELLDFTYGKVNETSLSLNEAIIARHKAKTPEKKAVDAVPKNARPFKGEYNSETESLRNYNGKTYIVPKTS